MDFECVVEREVQRFGREVVRVGVCIGSISPDPRMVPPFADK